MRTYAPITLSMSSVEHHARRNRRRANCSQSLLSLPKSTMNICKIMDDAGTFLAFGSQGGELAKIGTHKRPAVVRVRSFEKGEDIVALCNEHGWQVIVGVEEDEPEDTSDVEWLLSTLSNPPKVAAKPRLPPKISSNDYGPWARGNKFTKAPGAP